MSSSVCRTGLAQRLLACSRAAGLVTATTATQASIRDLLLQSQ